MMIEDQKYTLFLKFIKTYAPVGFEGIRPDDPLLPELENMMERNNQFFFVGDLIKVKILFTSKRIINMIGVNPADASPYHFFEATHPDDIQRHDLARSKLFSMGQGIFIEQEGTRLLSTNFRIRNPERGYSNLLVQCYMFHQTVPTNSVYLLQVLTGIDWYKKLKNGYHFYVGNDLSNFRYPDEDLLKKGNVLSDREFEIITLIKAGLDSEKIAEKLFLSKHTVNTHRTNILEKTGKSSIWEVIYELIEQGYIH